MTIQEEKEHWQKKLNESKSAATFAKEAIAKLATMKQPSCIELFGSVTQERSPYFSVFVEKDKSKTFKIVGRVEAKEGVYIGSEQKDAILTFVKEKYKVDYAHF